jgi:hypothetical protein
MMREMLKWKLKKNSLKQCEVNEMKRSTLQIRLIYSWDEIADLLPAALSYIAELECRFAPQPPTPFDETLGFHSRSHYTDLDFSWAITEFGKTNMQVSHMEPNWKVHVR